MLDASIENITFAPENTNSKTEHTNPKNERIETTLLIYTNKGIIKITAWNEQNGCYPHMIMFQWPGKEKEQQYL